MRVLPIPCQPVPDYSCRAAAALAWAVHKGCIVLDESVYCLLLGFPKQHTRIATTRLSYSVPGFALGALWALQLLSSSKVSKGS